MKTTEETYPATKIKVYGKTQNAIALGIIHAYVIMFPQTTLADLRKAFPNDTAPDKGANELGLTILCSLGDFDTLITGDMDAKTETKLVETYDLPDIEVLLVGHHGSKYSTGTTLLESVTPEAGVISVGDNSYGHPTEEALLRLTDAGMTVYRTDMQGNILITVD